MKGRWWLLSLLVLLLTGCGEYEEREREVGYKGLAKINHLLAAERLANEMGLKASSYAGAPSLPPAPRTTLVLPADALQSEGQLEEISDWVSEGGNLIVYLTLQNKRKRAWNSEGEKEEPFQVFLDFFEMAVEENEAEEGSSMRGEKVESLAFAEEEPYETDFRSPYLLSDKEAPETGSKAFFSYNYGEGDLTILGSAQLFDNQHLGKAEHATLLWDLLDMGQNEQVWFIHSTRLSFFKLLWQRAPQFVLLLLVTLALLVWWAARGFGPKFIRGTNPSAKLDEHLEASGAFFLKHKAEGLVIFQLRERLFRQLARATNQPINLSAGELIIAAKEQDVLKVEEQEALTSEIESKTLLETLRTLKNLEKRL